MKKRQAGMLLEAVIVSFIAVITVGCAAAMLSCAVALVQSSRDGLLVERAREKAIAELTSGRFSIASFTGEFSVENIYPGAAGTKLYIYRDGFMGRRGAFVLWP